MIRKSLSRVLTLSKNLSNKTYRVTTQKISAMLFSKSLLLFSSNSNDQKKLSSEKNQQSNHSKASQTNDKVEKQEMQKDKQKEKSDQKIIIQLLQSFKQNKDNQDKEKKNVSERMLRIQKRNYYFVVFGVIIALLAYPSNRIFQNIERKLRQWSIKNKYGEQEMKVEKFYTDKNSTQIKLEQMIDNFNTCKVNVIAGVAGMGKTSSIKQIAKKKRQKGEIFYYFNFRDQDQSQQLLEDEAKMNKMVKQKMDELIILIGQARLAARKRQITLIIDDINKIEGLSKDQMENLTLILSRGASNKNLKIFLISSSSSFYELAQEDPYLKKSGHFQILQPKNKSEMKESIESILKCSFDDQKFNIVQNQLANYKKQAAQYLANQQHSLRTVQWLINDGNGVKNKILNQLKKSTIKQISIPSIVSILAQLQQNLSNKIKAKIARKIFKGVKIQKNHASLLLQCLTEQNYFSQEISQNDCELFYKHVEQKLDENKNKLDKNYHDSIDERQQYIKKLDEANYIIYCRPRSVFIKSIMKEIVEQWKKNKSKKQ